MPIKPDARLATTKLCACWKISSVPTRYFFIFQFDLNLKGLVTPKDLVRIFTNTNPGMRVSYEVIPTTGGQFKIFKKSFASSSCYVKSLILCHVRTIVPKSSGSVQSGDVFDWETKKHGSEKK